jgi:hypothetical protein
VNQTNTKTLLFRRRNSALKWLFWKEIRKPRIQGRPVKIGKHCIEQDRHQAGLRRAKLSLWVAAIDDT